MNNNAIYTGGESFDRIFRALGDPHRIQIINLLKEKELSAGEILEAIDVVQSTLSHHMKTLSDSGAVNAVRRGKWTYYSLNESNLEQAAAFLSVCAEGTKIRRKEAAPRDTEEKKAGSGAAAKAAVKPAEKAAAKTAEKAAVKPAAKTAEKDAAKPEEKAADKERAGKKKDKKGKKSKKSKK